MHLALNSGILFYKKLILLIFYISDQKTENVPHFTWDHSNIVNYLPGMQIHVLQRTVAKLYEQARFKGYFKNHSLRATEATRLYDAGVDEQLITEKNWA